MLSSFIRRGAKRKGDKASKPRGHRKSPSTSSSVLSPLVLDINDESLNPSTSQSPQLVKLDLSGTRDDWFPQELLRSRSCSPVSNPPKLPSKDKSVRDKSTQTARVSLSPAPPPGRSDSDQPSRAARKKTIPTPILIPDVELRVPNIQIGYSAVSTPGPAHERFPPDANAPSLHPPPSPAATASDNLSSISGTTLARALIASTFVLSSERRSSRHRSVVRQDSATLPRPDSPIYSPIPPVPPVPPILPPTSAIHSGASTESEYPMSDAYITSPEIAGSSEPARRPRTNLSGTTSTSSPPVTSDKHPKERKGVVPARLRAVKNGASDVPKSAVEANPPEHVHGVIARHSSHEESLVLSSEDHSLDEFDFVPPEPLVVIASPGSDSSASYNPPVRTRSDTKRRRRIGGSNFVRRGSKDRLDVPPPSQQPGHPMPSATISENDFGELLNYDLTVSPGSSSSSNALSAGSAGYQTFPETPMVFSPLFSPAYAILSKSDTQVLRTRPLTPRSAMVAHGPKKLAPSTKAVPRQVANNSDKGSALRRSRSSSLPRQEPASRPRQDPPSSTQESNEERVSDETERPSTDSTVDSQKIGHLKASVRPHPLAHISTSSSFVPEEEALRALARDSSFIMGDDAALPVPAPKLAPVSDLLGKSSAPVLFPKSTDKLPPNTPGAENTASSSRTPLPALTTTADSQPKTPKSSLCAVTSSIGESFLPSPSASPSDGPLSALSPLQTVGSQSAVSDETVSPSFFPPPPYHSVVSERTAYHPGSISPPALSSAPSSDSDVGYQRSRQASNSSNSSGTLQGRGRSRPAAPLGPRKPSGLGQILGPLASEAHDRTGSVSSITSSDPSGPSPWAKLQAAASKPPPKFQKPPPKWRGLTLEAAQWTFTSAQLQEVVSRAIQQSSEGSSIRLLRLEVLEGEVADEMHRLELQHTDVKTQYKVLWRKRWSLMGTLANQIEGAEMTDASRTMETLAEVLAALDQVADQMHDIVLRMSQLKSLHDVHNASALALAVRKINGVFVRQMAEKECLQEHIETLKTERDEAWKQAETVAREYDTLHDRVSDAGNGGGNTNADAQSTISASSNFNAATSSKRSTRINAARNSCNRISRAGLRSRSRHRHPSDAAARTRPSSLVLGEPIPPVPRVTVNSPEGYAISTGMSLGSTCSYYSHTSEAIALAVAQREVYEMLGLSVPESGSGGRRRTLSSSAIGASSASPSASASASALLKVPPTGRGHPHAHALGALGLELGLGFGLGLGLGRPRPMSESFHVHTHACVGQQERGRATRSVFVGRG